MTYSYRITKYFLESEKGYLISNSADWTSFYDVGIKTSLDDYMRIENAYVEIIIKLCSFLEISSLFIDQLEIYDKDVSLDYNNNSSLELNKIDSFVRMILREKIWCKLKSQQCEFHFGYDYYMYFVSAIDLSRFIERTTTALNVQKFTSPYLE